jgi:hypothetical protein
MCVSWNLFEKRNGDDMIVSGEERELKRWTAQ